MPVPPLSAELSTAIDGWLSYLKDNRGRADSTVEKYRDYLMRLVRWCAEPPQDLRLRASTADPLQLTAEDIERFAGAYAHSTGLAPSGRRPIVSALRGFFAFTRERGITRTNPAERLPQPRCGRHLPRALGLHHAERLIMAPDTSTFLGVRDAAMLLMLAGTGVRLSGLLGLNESSLLWYRDDDGADRLSVRVREKGNRERIVPVPPEATVMLRAYLAHEDLAAIDRTLPDGDKVLWVTTRNHTCPPHEYHGERRRLAARTFQDMIEAYGERAKVPEEQRNPHALRHLYGTELAESDADLLVRQALLGHTDPKATEIYTHLAARKMQKVVDDANPLGKMRSPLLDTLRQLDRAVAPAPARPASNGASNANRPGRRMPRDAV